MITCKEGWQPARFWKAHEGHPKPRSPEDMDKINKTILPVRPYTPTEFEIKYHYRRLGCDATRFYLVDTGPLGELKDGDGPYLLCCEHEILTD